MKNKKSTKVIVLLISIIIIGLLSSNHIAVYFFKGTSEVILKKGFTPDSTDKLYALSIDSINIVDDSGKNITTISGWGLLKNNTGHNRITKLLFASNQNTYAGECLNVTRNDYNIMQESMQGVVAISTKEVGFQIEFSPILMEDGLYHVGLYIEDDGHKALSWTNRFVYKQKGQLSLIEDKEFLLDLQYPKVENFKNVEKDSSIIGNIEYYDYTEDNPQTLLVSGWLAYENMDCSNQKVYIQCVNNNNTVTFSADSILRSDVATFYNNEAYSFSGFQAYINPKHLTPGKNKINVIVDNNTLGMFGNDYEIVINP